jgi:threonylcarbamoyladenosine tRNA methylthiotransferase MtaB
MIVGFHTLGCKLNQFETEALAYCFNSEGCEVVSGREEADLYIVNTCTVTVRADHKARAYIRGIAKRRPGVPILVTGCSAELETEALRVLSPNVIVVPQSRKSGILGLAGRLSRGTAPCARDIAQSLSLDPGGDSGPFKFEAPRQSFHSRAFLKIQDGCDGGCAYCRVPLARGPSMSLPAGEVMKRARELERGGYREIVLTGVNISAYLSGGQNFSRLIRGLLDSLDRARLRLSSLEPETVTDELAETLADPRICAHFHLPVQSGSDAILKKMLRRYTASEAERAVSRLRKAKTDPFLAADILVGFPGEADEDFMTTRRLVEKLDFSSLHVFRFSPRPGTAAAVMREGVPQSIASARAAELGALSRRLARRYRERWAGRDVEVLLERGPRRFGIPGVSSNYLKVEVTGLTGRDAPEPGALVMARLSRHVSDRTGLIQGNFRRFMD